MITVKEAEIAKNKKSLAGFDARYVSSIAERWKSLHFEASGLARLCHCGGFFRGLIAAGKEDVAEALTVDLDRSLTGLNEFGGKVKIAEEAPSNCTVPAYRVVLSDDGTFGGFSLLWFRFVSSQDLMRATKTEESYAAAKERLRIRDDLQIYRSYYPTWDEERKNYVNNLAHYYLSFNGALIYRGPGGDMVFSVQIGTEHYWTVHT